MNARAQLVDVVVPVCDEERTLVRNVEALLRYLEAEFPWTLIVSSEQEAAPHVIAGESVAAMGGFTGRETVLTGSYLASLVRSGEARYFLLGGGGPGPFGSSNSGATLVASVCKQVSLDGSTGTLYDCAGKAAAIALAG